MSFREHERTFALLGTEVRLLIGEPARPGLPSPEFAAIRVEAFLRQFHQALTRFDPRSELSQLNADQSEVRVVTPLLLLALRAGLWAADRSGGLVDPVMVDRLERAGYDRSWVEMKRASLIEALATAPDRHPARPSPERSWQAFELDRDSSAVRRPRGLRFDSGGTGKGLAVDLASRRLGGYLSNVVDAGGDVRIGGTDPPSRLIEVTHPLREEIALEFELARGAVATSGLGTRVWRNGDDYSHHILDPSTGEPAWTGVIQATALGPTALEAETLAKLALLSGPDRGPSLLEPDGGALILDSGDVVPVGALAKRRASESVFVGRGGLEPPSDGLRV
jgi:thiamine biosynthesis lipoprotein